jgi:hypothetical protein
VQSIFFALLAAALILTVLGQSIPARKTPARDYGIYLYTGAQILKGGLPYRDAWESKPPGIFYLDALALWLGRGTRWGVWAIEVVSLLAAITFSFNLMRRLWGTWAALFGLLTWLYGLNWSLMGGNLTEEYPLPLHFLALSLFPALVSGRPKRALDFLLGVLFALCFLFRPNNAVVEAAIILTLLVARAAQRDFRALAGQMAWIAAGAALPMGITAAYFQAHGLLRELLEASVLYNLIYSGTPLSTNSPLQIGWQILRGSLWIAAAGYLVAALMLWRRGPDKWLYVLLLTGWPMLIFLSDPAKRNYVHYYMNWLPFIGLLAALAFHFVQGLLIPGLKDSPSLRLAGLAVALALTGIFFISNGMVDDYQKVIGRLRAAGPTGAELKTPLSIYINEETQPGQEVLFWGGYPGENFMSKRDTPSAALFYPLYLESGISNRLNERFLRELEANRPVVIVDMGDQIALSLDKQEREKRRAAGVGWTYLPPNLDRVFAFIDENYSLEKKFRGLGIYRLKGSDHQTQ